MPLTNKHGVCCICGKKSSNIHMHHTIPRSLGGENSLQIPLDGDCHTKLHAHANAIVALARGSRKKSVKSTDYWETPEEIRIAEKWVMEIYNAVVANDFSDQEKMTLLPQLRVGEVTRSALEILKRDNNLNNIENTLEYCIQFTLTHQGILNNENKNGKINQGHNSTASREGELRRLRRSDFGTDRKARTQI